MSHFFMWEKRKKRGEMCKEYATRDIVKEIKQSLQGKQYILQHIMREDKVSWLCKKNVGIDKGKYTF